MNLGNNDEVHTLLKHLPKLIHFNKENNVRSLYIAEFNAPNDHYEYYLSAQKEIQEVVSEAGVPIIDKNREFASIHKSDEAVLWWDYVHMSNAGQEIVSDWLVDAINNNLYRQ